MKFSKTCFAFFLVSLAAFSSFGQKVVPELWGQRIHDDAHILRQETVDQLEKQLKQYEDSTTNQIAVLIVQSLEGEVVEDYSLKVMEKWKLGTQGKDNGVLVLIAIDDHKIRIEVGLGLEGVLTDAICNRIIRNEMAPTFRRGDYDAGIIAAIYSIIHAIGGEYSSTDKEGNDLDDMSTGGKIALAAGLFVFLGIFAGIGLFSKGYMTWVLYAFMMPFYAVFMGLMFGWWIFFGYVILYPLLRFWVIKSGRKLMEWQSGGGGSGSGWSSSGSSSGSSFSGGGGSFGGGGSSGGW
jgi:uncharacterized protein